MVSKEISESKKDLIVTPTVRETLEKFERSKILEIYFSRLDGRIPQQVSGEYEELYAIELPAIKAFLLGQHPQDTLLQKIFRIMT